MWKGRARYAAVAGLLALTSVADPAALSMASPRDVTSGPGQFSFSHGADGNQPLQMPVPPVGSGVAAISARTAPAGRQMPPLLASLGIPATVLRAYRESAETVATSDPSCRLSSALLAAIGKVESGHAQGGHVKRDGTTREPILGPALDGRPGVAAISDTDAGSYDGDQVWDHAVGPMQFIPSTWARWRADGNGDGSFNPHNVFDAALAAGNYLCAGNRNLRDPEDLAAAILGYNRSQRYLFTVLSWMRAYDGAAVAVPDGNLSPRGSGPQTAMPSSGNPTGEESAPPPARKPAPPSKKPPKAEPTPREKGPTRNQDPPRDHEIQKGIIEGVQDTVEGTTSVGDALTGAASGVPHPR
ncbi:lytic transglycosylase domain-containing protein [Streptomyces sp. NPDC005202]|uniref:lytic transglycosylase domain-containing protein n=1 Tax=Streptomyces sp. NPDC005202 TaxID=3157021 RepID=UPI0033B166D0